MPEITNPVKLGFRVAEAGWREETTISDEGCRSLPAIPLREVFADDLERTLWLAIKQRHLTSQMFNHQVREAAVSIRQQPPKDAIDLHRRIERMTGLHWDDRSRQRGPDPFCEELLIYVLSALGHGTRSLGFVEPDATLTNSVRSDVEPPDVK